MNTDEILRAHGVGAGNSRIPIHKAGIAATNTPVWELIGYGQFTNENRWVNAPSLKMDEKGDIYFISSQPGEPSKIFKVNGQTGEVIWRSVDDYYRIFDVDQNGNVFGINSPSTSLSSNAKMRKLNSITGAVEWEYALIPPSAWTGSYPVAVWAGGGNNVITVVIGQDGVNEFFTGVNKSTGVASFRDVNLKISSTSFISPNSGDIFGMSGNSISRYSNINMSLVSNLVGFEEKVYPIGLVGDTAYWVEANVPSAGGAGNENAFTIRRGEAGELVTGIGVGGSIGGRTISCTPNSKFITAILPNLNTGATGGTAADRMIVVIDHKTSAQFTIISPRMGILGIPVWIGVNGELITIDSAAKKLRKYKLNIIKN
ncbi:hypothetical protein J31TS6_57090 [Brevibacillus reuszeri]|uniref:hypothetical protein n=1 Tax=Brevibacillus reuszeri TaxID=54915 RepID=UPI001B01F760|nr:hypothetical protein [Brevibacillus reuszeri]GIO09681.1 hypothetical protein J31TS6_57090 [Brevibacillus reuszeri]